MTSRTSKLASLPVSLPTGKLPEDIAVRDVAHLFTDALSLLTDPANFVNDAVWRDCFALTGTLRTFYSARGITQAWQQCRRKSAEPIEGSYEVTPDAAMVMKLPSGHSWVEVRGSFKTRTRAGLVGCCTLMLSVVPGDTESWKIWSMRTILVDIESWPSVNNYTPSTNIDAVNARTNGHTNRYETKAFEHVDVVVVGGGQAGLSTAGRLQALGINYILLDKYKQVGDNWATRYDSARLHTIREYSHLPFDRTFTKERYQEFLTKNDLARGYREWTGKFGIDEHIWLETELKSGRWDDAKQRWTLNVLKQGQEKQVQCRFVVMCTGAGGQSPSMPNLPDRELFKGDVLHSQSYRSSKPWSSKHGIVIGTGNTAHDIASDMLEANLTSTTMIQRSTTYVLPAEYWQKLSSRTYNEHIPTDVADTLGMSGPNAVGRLLIKTGLDALAAQESERFDALERAGFQTERYGDLTWHLLERAGGHIMDVGMGKKIANGEVKIQQGPATRYTSKGLAFGDGTELQADVIVWATGFEVNLRESVRRLFGDDVADRIDDFFGIDDEGEIRGVWKIQHPGLICHGIALGQARYFSKYIALQIKAVLEGKPFEQYLNTPVPPRLQQ